jgi:hypothetical protein
VVAYERFELSSAQGLAVIVRRCLVTLALLASMLTWSPTLTASGSPSGGTTVSVAGDTVNINVNIDLLLDQYANAQFPLSDADRQKFGGLASAISDYWNAGLANHPYRGCLKLHVNVVVNLLLNHDHVNSGYPFDSSEVGNHMIHWRTILLQTPTGPNGEYGYANVRPTIYDPTRPRGVPGDFPSPYETGLPGDWSPAMETTRDYAHEVGHLMGLDDDYRDVDNGDGTWSSQSVAGREGTLMDSGDAIDQNLADRMGDVIGKAGIQLPTCWIGTMTSSSNYTVTAADGGLVCSASWTTDLKFTVAADATVTGTATSTMQGAQVCTHPEFFPTPMTTLSSNITGTATATQLALQLNAVSYQPAGSIDATGMSASIYGFNNAPATITIPINTPGHAEGSQQLQTISAVNSYTSENTLTLDCRTC